NVIRSARLYSKERQQAQELDAVHHTALHIVAQDNLNTLLQTLVEEATHLLHAKGGKVYLKVPDEEMLELEAAYYVNPEIHPVGTRLAFGQGLVGDVIKHGRAKVINNYAKWPGRVNKLSSLFSSLVAVPLWIGNEIIGVLAVFDVVDSRHFSNDDIPILDRLAQQASLAINNARLLGQIRSQRKEQIDAVRDITNSITSPPDNLEDVLESMLDWAVSIMKEGSIGDIRILDAQNQTLTPVVARMPPNLDLLEHYRTTTVGEGITGWVAQHRQPKMSNDVSADARYLPSVTEMGSEIAIPLMRENELLGVLNIEHMDRDAFTEEDLQWADAIGGLASVAIENNRLFREVENRAVRLETLQEIATAISAAQSDINSLLRLIVVSLNSIFDDAPVAIRLYDAAKNVFEPDSVTTDNWPEGELSTPRPNGTSQHVIRTLEPLYIDDTENPQLPETLQLREMLLRHQVKSLAVLPLISKGRPIGVLYLQLLQSRQFTESDKQILRLFAEQAVVAIINAKSNEELDRQRVMRIQAVQDIARTIPIAAEQGQKEVLQSVVDAVAPIVGDAEYLVLIRLLDKETNELVLEATSMQGVVINQQLIQRVPVSVGIMGWVARNKEYRCVPDVSRESEYRRGLRNARSELAVPMLLDDEVIGVLTIEHSELDAFTELDIQMTQAFARLAVVAYENAQLYDAVAQRNDQLQALYDAGIKINGQLDDASVLRSIAENVCELLDPDITTIFPYNEETSQFQEGVRISSTKQPVPKPGMEGFASRLIQEKRPIFDYRQFMGNDQPLTIDGREAKAFMSIPLRFEKKTVGLLLLNYFEERQFTEDEKRLASLFGLQAATAINNARQYEIAQEHARQERWIELGRVAGSLAHRIGNNGGTIRLRADDLAEYLKERLPKDDYVDTTMETIIRNNQYILEMADLLFRPVKASGEPVVSVNIALMLDSALGIGSPGIPPDVMICRQYASKLPTVKANRWFIEVFVEIIANAIGAMQGSASKNLVVHTTEDERWLRIHFSDTGKGIPQREQERIFDLFTSSGKETNGQHSGFGLWWVRTFVRDMGGNVEIESQPGQGTTFTVVLRKEE
ncbi:MAG: GAF domain-containing protein, partial [Chloroflexota bacterium]